MEELALPLTKGFGPTNLDWPNQLPPKPTCRASALSWPASISIPPMTCWCFWRDWSCETIATGSPWLKTVGYLKGVSVSIQYWWCTRNERPWTRSTIYCNEHSKKKLSGEKGILSGTLKLPVPLRSIEELRKIDPWSGLVFYSAYNQYFLNLHLWGHYMGEEQIWRTENE